ncbi:MAG: VOC family protein [Gemmatimonadales bacterium]
MLTVDHALILAADLDQAALAYRRLGFSLTPRGYHQGLGSANHTIMLKETYLELLGILDPEGARERWSHLTRKGPGLRALAYRSRDARADRAALVSRGVEARPVVDFSRPVPGPDGGEARFSLSDLPESAMSVLPGFLCQHHTPELVWRRGYLLHPNSAVRLVGCTVAATRPAAAALEFERVLGRARVHPHPGGMAVDLGSTRLWLVEPGYARRRLGHAFPDGEPNQPLGLSVEVLSLGAARASLAAGGVPFAPFGSHSIIVGPTWTAGIYLEFLALG